MSTTITGVNDGSQLFTDQSTSTVVNNNPTRTITGVHETPEQYVDSFNLQNFVSNDSPQLENSIIYTKQNLDSYANGLLLLGNSVVDLLPANFDRFEIGDSGFNPVGGAIVQEAGTYRIEFAMHFEYLPTYSGTIKILVFENSVGTGTPLMEFHEDLDTEPQVLDVSGIFDLEVGDDIRMEVQNISGSANNARAWSPTLTIEKLT